MATGFVQALSAAGTSAATASVVLTLTATPAKGGLVAVPCRALGATADVTSPASDTKGNTWQFLKSASAGHRAVLFWTTQDIAPLVSGDTVTLTQTTTGGISGRVYEFLPCRPGVDSSGTNTVASGTSMIIPSASFTPNLANDLVLSVLTHTATATGHSIDSSFTVIDAATVTRAIASLVTPSVANRQATWSWTTSVQSAGVAAAFQILPPAQPSVVGQAVTRAAFW